LRRGRDVAALDDPARPSMTALRRGCRTPKARRTIQKGRRITSKQETAGENGQARAKESGVTHAIFHGFHPPRLISGPRKPVLESVRHSEITISLGLALIVGVAGAGAAYIFRNLILGFQHGFFHWGQDILAFMGDYYVIIIPALGGAIVGPLVYFFAREARGHGVPEVMNAVALQGGRIRPRVVIIKALASAITIGSGGSVGREGPIVHIGSAVGSTIGQKLGLPSDWIKTLVAAGAAAGISATFNAPIAGIFFAMEVILRRYESRAFGVIVLSSVVASAITQTYIDDEPAFIVPHYELASAWEFALYPVLGVLAAFTAHIFVTVLYWIEDIFEEIKVVPSYTLPIFGGLIIGAIGLFYPQVFGVGYSVIDVFDMPDESIDGALIGNLSLALMVTLLVVKVFATSITLGSGGSGGVFAPSLFLGAMLGGAFGVAVNDLFPDVTAPSGAYAIVGMAAVFAGGARAPGTAIIILFEMTRDYQIILPLMSAVIIAVAVAQALRKENIYTIKLRRRGIDIDGATRGDVLNDVFVRDVMTRDFPTVRPDQSVSELTKLFAETGHHGFPVVDAEGSLTGVVTMTDLSKVQQKNGNTLVEDIATHRVLTVHEDQTLHDALARFGGQDVGRIPVVERQNPKKLVGVLRRHDIVKAYAREISTAISTPSGGEPQPA
jgi:CIC family chloride channel protein